MENCIFCKIINGKIPSVKIFEDNFHLAFLDVNPTAPGHTLVISKTHNEYLFDMKDDEYVKLLLFSKKIAKVLKSALEVKRVGVIVEGFLVNHTHIHLIPINNGGELFTNSRKSNFVDLENVAKKIKLQFENNQ